LYDENGSAYSFIYNGTQYYYVKNLQGDVVKILNTSGGVVASYTYDAWGKVTSSGSIGQINPIRYRGYYYDTDTGFYYLQSRYYDPAIKRFISADGYLNANGDLLGFNMYAYCGNNPNTRTDTSGESWKDICAWIEDKWTKATNWFINAKKWSDKHLKNGDGTHSFSDNHRGKVYPPIFHEQFLSYDPVSMENEFFSQSLCEGGSITVYTAGWEIPLGDCTLDLSLFDFGTASLEMWLSQSTFGMEVSAAIWAPTVKIETPKFTFEVGCVVGGLGEYGFKFGNGTGISAGKFKFSFTYN